MLLRVQIQDLPLLMTNGPLVDIKDSGKVEFLLCSYNS